MRTMFRGVVQCFVSSLFVVTLLVAIPQTARAATYTVCNVSCSHTSPEAAVSDPMIADGDTIEILATTTYELSATLQVDHAITILANDSVFDAMGNQRAIEVVAGANLSLSNVTIRNGQAPGGEGGGAIRVSDGSTISVINGIFENNQADFGGAIYNNGSTVNMNVATFSGNWATAGDGGAIYTDNIGVTNLTRTTVDGNQASVAGGGLAVSDKVTVANEDLRSQLNLIASTVSNNVALSPVQTESNLVISLSTVGSCGTWDGQTFIADATVLSAFEFEVRTNGNTNPIPNDLNIPGQVRLGGPTGPVIATASAFVPGGVWLGGSSHTLTFILDQPVALIPGNTYAIESIVSGAYSTYISNLNTDVYAGGARYCNGSGASYWDYMFRTFGGPAGDGGGIYASAGGFAGLFNTTVSGNVGDGATAAPDSIVNTLFSTVTNNSGNGLTAQDDEPTGGLVFVTASIIAGNGFNDCVGSTTSSGYNLIGDVTGCIVTPFTGDLVGDANIPIDPGLDPLQDNGGWTATHALDPGSPAVDAGGANGAIPCSDAAQDQRGVVRPDGPACDIGAYEVGILVSTAPLQTLINSAAPGAIIDVDSGTYNEQITIGDGKTLRGTTLNSVVIDADGLGGPAITATGDFALENILVINGHSPGNGGGIFANIAGTDITLNNVEFDNNDADSNGGAIYLPNGTLDATNITITNSDAGGDGGGIFSGATATIIASLFESNSAVSAGGAIFNDGNMSITDTTVSISSAATGGGIYSNDPGDLLYVTGSTFSENIASNTGVIAGGAIGGASTMEIRNSTLSGNATSGNGGGIGLTGGTALLNNVTLAFNDASSGFGGAVFADYTAFISLSNSLLSTNAGGPTNCSNVISLGYNLFQSTSCPTAVGDITAEPLINFLAPNGGLTQTHSLQGLSPAVNAGHPVPSFPQFDSGNFSLLQTQGGASLDSGALLLADSTTFVGSAFVTNPIDSTQDFSATFQFRITPGVDGAADGITFTISDSPSVLGHAGGFLGIARRDQIEQIAVGVVNGVSVEFDTWLNGSYEGANDPASDHIGIDINGNLSSVVIANLGAQGILSDGNVWTAWVDYDAVTTTLEVRAANNGIRPAAATLSYIVDIASLTGPTAYAGFTAGAAVPGFGNLAGTHRILNFSFNESCEPNDQRGDSRPKGAACDIGAFEGEAIPLQLGTVDLSTVTLGQDLGNGTSYPGVVDVPIIDIPIEKLTGDTFNSPSSAPLGSFPLGSFPIGSFDLRNSPLGSFPLGSFPIGSFPLGSFPLGSFPLSSIPLQSAGGWAEILDGIPEFADAPLQAVTLEQLLTLNPLPDSVATIALRDLAIENSPLGSFSLPGVSLGATTVDELDDWSANAGEADTVCATLFPDEGPPYADCDDTDTLLGLEAEGAPVSALSLSSLPLGSFPIGSFPMGSFPIGSFPLGSFPLGSFPIGSFPIGSFPMGSFPLGSFPIGSFPMGSFNLLAAPLGSFPLGSFPIGSFPLGSFEIDGKSFCEFYDEQADVDGDKTCAQLSVSPGTDTLTDLVEALQREAASVGDTTGGIGSTPLGSFPMGSFPIGSFPIGSFPIGSFDLGSAPLSLLTLTDFDGCEAIYGAAGCSLTTALSESSSLADVSAEYGSLAASPLGSFPIGSFGIADLPMGSFPIGSFDVNGAPLGSFPLGSFDLIYSPMGSFPLGSFPLGSFAVIIDDPEGVCSECLTLADAARAGVISTTATLSDLAGSPDFAAATLGVVLDAMTLATLYCPPDPDPSTGPLVDCAETLGEIKDPGNLTLGQLLVAMMLKTDFPWETIPLAQLDVQEFSADNFIAYLVDIPLTGTESEALSVAVTLDDSFLYRDGSASVVVETPLAVGLPAPIADPVIMDNSGSTQTLTFDLTLGGFGATDNTIRFEAVPAMELGDYPATATVQLGTDIPVVAENTNATVTIIPDPDTDISEPGLALTTAVDVLSLGFINHPDDNDYYMVAAPAAGDRVAVFMSNPASDNDLIMYEPVTTVEAKGQLAESSALDSVPFEDDGVSYSNNLTEEPNALEDVNLATAPLASISTNRDGIDESVSAIAGDTAPFTIQVSGYNGAVSDQPYTLRVKVTPQVPSPQCTARTWPIDASSTVFEPEDTWMPDTNAVFLVNWARLAASDPGGAAAADDALIAINSLINAPGITNGVVIDVSSISSLNHPGYALTEDYANWDANPCDVDAANGIVNAITKYLEEQRAIFTELAYVTIVGSDEVIPFARKPDETSIANESTFAGEFSDNAMFGALVTRHFLSDDTYGDIDPIAWLDRYLNVPELGVGRLVESAGDIQVAAQNYIDSAGILNPQTALSAGYDFIADASEEIDDTFNAYGPTLGFNVEDGLIDQPGVLPGNAWDRERFLGATGLDPAISTDPIEPVDMVSFNMHFDFDEALPSSGDAGGDYTGNLITTADLGTTDLTGGIWFTVGCHSGSSVADVSVVGAAPSEDWAQAFSRLGALYLAQNAYGLGDTEAVALTERLMANFALNLNGSLSIGQAHAFAKQQYFANLGLYGEYDYKALQAATLFGLPMYQYGNGAMVVDPPAPPLPVSADPLSGLTSASWSLSDTGITQTTGTSKGDLFSVDGEVQFVHFRPLQPIVRRDVTGPAGEVAGGAFLTSLVTEDIFVSDIAFARPVIDLGENELEIEFDEGVFPTAFTNIASFKAPPPAGGLFEPRQQLNVIVGQFTSPRDGSSSGTERLFESFDAQVFYRPAATAATTMAMASAAVADDFIRPEFDNVQASVVGSGGAQQAAFSVDVFDEGTVLRVAVLYLQSVSASDGKGNWVLVDLVQGGGGHTWTGGGPVDLTGVSDGQIDYMVQAVDANGNVANSTFKGLFYVAEQTPTPPAPDPADPPGDIAVVVSVDGDVIDPGDWISSDPVDVIIVNQDPETTYVYSVDFAPFVPLGPTGFVISEDGVHIVTVQESDGSNPVTFVILIDTTAPLALITTPADGEFVEQGQEPAAEYDCVDSGSGISTCVGTVPDGNPVPSLTPGSQTFVLTAQDYAHQDDIPQTPVLDQHVYHVVKPLEVGGPINPTAITDPVTITTSATDLTGFTETVTIDWGDGSMPETLDIGSASVDNLSTDHIYPPGAAGVYQVTVTVDYEGQYTQVGVVDFVVVYDSSAGFVTGGGWINSPSGAYTPGDSSDPDLTGKAHFGFVSKYKKGQSTPDGSTDFRFGAGNLEFEATVYDWMIISGANARYKGEGTIEGNPGLYKFMVTANDADISGHGITEDGFRIKIWQQDSNGVETVLYDNGLGVDSQGGTTALGGGSIKIHTVKKKK